MIAWTTVENAAQAEELGRALIESKFAVCVQIDGPIASIYRWQGNIEQSSEFRLTIKFLALCQVELEACLMSHHPYSTPEWIVVRSEHVAEKYLSWAQANSSSLPFNASQEPLSPITPCPNTRVSKVPAASS